MINSVVDVQEFVDFVKYLLFGKRSWGFYCVVMLKGMDVLDYFVVGNIKMVLFVMIEMFEVLVVLDDILVVLGIDGVFVGFVDLLLMVLKVMQIVLISDQVFDLVKDIV